VTGERDYRRRRVVVFAGMWLLISGLLTALSLVVVVLVASFLMLVASLAVVAYQRFPRPDLGRALRTSAHATKVSARATASTARAARARVPRPHVREHARELGARAKSTTAAAPVAATRAARGSLDAMYRLGVLQVQSVDPSQLALELNERGAQLRRDGAPEQAAEQHRAALALVRDIGDQHAEALTLNNLGLALAHSGSDEAAVEHLEQAVDVLRELGDEEYEARVIANLGLVYRRQGYDDEAATLFTAALEKLPPESPAYRQVEQELSRAS
jgi:tetratricopeptide (TPR) repeat protein